MRAAPFSPFSMLPASKAASTSGECMATQYGSQKLLHVPARHKQLRLQHQIIFEGQALMLHMAGNDAGYTQDPVFMLATQVDIGTGSKVHPASFPAM